jgi:hypothetical protein
VSSSPFSEAGDDREEGSSWRRSGTSAAAESSFPCSGPAPLTCVASSGVLEGCLLGAAGGSGRAILREEQRTWLGEEVVKECKGYRNAGDCRRCILRRPFHVSLESYSQEYSLQGSEDAPTFCRVMTSRTPRHSVLFSHQAIAIERPRYKCLNKKTDLVLHNKVVHRFLKAVRPFSFPSDPAPVSGQERRFLPAFLSYLAPPAWRAMSAAQNVRTRRGRTSTMSSGTMKMSELVSTNEKDEVSLARRRFTRDEA